MQGGGHRTGCLGTSGGHYVTMPLWSLAQQLSLGHGRHIGLDGEWGSVTGLGVSVSSVHMHVRACVHSCVPVCIRVCVCAFVRACTSNGRASRWLNGQLPQASGTSLSMRRLNILGCRRLAQRKV